MQKKNPIYNALFCFVFPGDRIGNKT
jgi:hypothetical protein